EIRNPKQIRISKKDRMIQTRAVSNFLLRSFGNTERFRVSASRTDSSCGELATSCRSCFELRISTFELSPALWPPAVIDFNHANTSAVVPSREQRGVKARRQRHRYP